VAAANAATVRVLADDKAVALGTVVSADGYILTKASELRGTLTVRRGDGSEHDAEVVGVHKPTDLALLKIAATGLKPVAFADTKGAAVGDWLAAAGTGTAPTGVGIVSVSTRKVAWGFAADTTINRNRGFLGVTLADDDPKGGAVVRAVSPGGAAAKAKVARGDVIVEVNGAEVTGAAGLMEVMDAYRPGDKVTVRLRRAGEEVELQLKLTGNVEKSRSDIQNEMGGELSGRRTGFPAVLQTDLVVAPMNCGGPVVDLDGKVLGVCIARGGRVETWVLPGELIRPLVDDLKAGKYKVAAAKPAAKKTAPVSDESDDK
ncbi:MAG: S1C family serine protease, partial [Gemmataceae bacterium]|nr:S1C family serine protease [Gemmataceae bacterium]